MRKYLFGSVAALALVVGAACSGGTSNAPTVPYPTPANLGNATLSSSSASNVAIAASTGLGSGVVTLKGTGSVSVTQSTTAPTGTKTLSARTLARSKGVTPQATTAPNTPVAYVTVTATSATTLSSIISLQVAPATIPNGTYYMAFWNGTQWVTIGGSGKITDGVINFSSSVTFNPALSLASGASYYIAVYTGQIFTTPTPPPPSPVASPASPVTISLQTSVKEYISTNPNSTVTAQSSDTSIVTVEASETSDSTGVATFTLTASNTNVGTAKVTFTDQIGQTTSITVNTSNSYAPPNPSQNNLVFSLGSQSTLTVTTKPNTQVTAQSSNTGVFTVTPSATADSNGTATFTVTAAGPGTATVTFTDSFAQTGTFSGTVSNIQNGAFTNGLTGWTPCSYAHTALTATVNEATPSPVSPLPTQSPGAATAAIAASSLTGLSAVVTPPPNDNPSPPPGVGPTAPPVLGTSVALVGSLDDSVNHVAKGESGICQTINVSANTPYLSFWIWDGGENYTFKTSDQNAVVLDSSGTNVLTTLFAEQHCYFNPSNNLGSPGVTLSSSSGQKGCWPAGDATGGNYKDWVGGGFWTMRGPFDLSSYAGQTVVLYVGNYSYYANTTNVYSNFLFLGNVQMLPTNTFPTSTPLSRTTHLKVQLHPRH